jgi:dephospho-CoA kinase
LFTVALTGEVNSGKSTLARVWGDLGANIIDSDTIAKEQWRRPDIIERAARRWGEGVVLGGEPDYKKIADIIFSSEEEHEFASALRHPATISEVAKRIQALSGWVVVEAPLIFESGWFDLIDCVICVTSTDELRTARNSLRGWGEDEIKRRERYLIGTAKKQSLSDMVLCNIGSIEAWEARAREMGEMMLRMSSVIELSTVCGRGDNAKLIASELIEGRLAASVSIVETASVYRWKGKVRDENEWRVVCLTTENASRRARECILHHHTYEQPVIFATEVRRSDFDTLKWVVDNCE